MYTQLVTSLNVSPTSRRTPTETKRKDNPTITDIAIYMADAVAGQSPTATAHLPDGLLRLTLGKIKLKTTLQSLKLENAMNKIIPLH
jgi:hypothetical protein